MRLLLIIRNWRNLAYIFSAHSSTCCSTNMNFQLYHFRANKLQTLQKKREGFFENSQNLSNLHYRWQKKYKMYAKSSLISPQLPVLRNVEFLKGEFNVKSQICVIQFLNKYARVFLKFSHITSTCHETNQFYCLSC